MRIGAVNYLNSKPLVYGLDALAPQVRVTYDLPSRLADSLFAERLDVALVPSVEFFRTAGSSIVSDACVACRGPVLSVKLHFRVPPADVRRVALDEGSRTSAALTRILLAEMHDIQPKWEPLPIGCGIETTDADAVLLIGDRAIADGSPNEKFTEVWDLGERWCDWTGVPFVFAMWIARAGIDPGEIAGLLGSARDNGVQHLAQIAKREGPLVGVTPELAITYFRDNLHFVLGDEERTGLRKFYALCAKHGLAPTGGESQLASSKVAPAKVAPGSAGGFSWNNDNG
jgi:chorismate dehydratase